jgi:hypothetical protein
MLFLWFDMEMHAQSIFNHPVFDAGSFANGLMVQGHNSSTAWSHCKTIA